jgi:hypothetical protein
MAEEPTGGFLRSLPGVVTALAGLITAVGGLLGALLAAGSEGRADIAEVTGQARVGGLRIGPRTGERMGTGPRGHGPEPCQATA